MKFSTIHTHTTYSDGKNTARENIESAIEKGMRSIGFSDHSFTACDPSYCMRLEDYPKYIADLRALGEEYKDRIPVFCGIEKDYYSDINKSDFDYVIGSVHYIVRGGVCYPVDHTKEQQEACARAAFGGSLTDMAKCYFDMVCEQASTVRPDVIGHFDVITKFSYMPEFEDKYMAVAEDALKECLKWCNTFEVNTGGIARGWRKNPYPNLHLLKLLNSLGGRIVLNSDSHKAETLDCAFPEAIDFIKSAGFTRLHFFDGKDFYAEDV